MDGIKITAIIYVKNTVKYIEKCIRSVMAQTLREIEILVIDGGSTDGTLAIIRKLESEDYRIRVLHTSASVGAQFNLGLKKARGEYIGVCEADDYILPDMYEKQYKIAKENQLDVIRAGYYQICDINGTEYRFGLKPYVTEVQTETVIECSDAAFFLAQGVRGFWNGIYKRQFLLEHQIWMNETKGAAYQDITFSFLTQMYAKRIWFTDEAFYCYRIDNSDASSNSLYGIKVHMEEYRRLKERLIEAGQWELYKNIFFSWELASYRWFLSQLPIEQRDKNAREVYRQLEKQNKENRYNMNCVMKTVEELAGSIVSGEQDFVNHILSGTEQCKLLFDYIAGPFKKEHKIILFGMGHMGNMIHLFLKRCQKEVYFMDNNKCLQRDGIEGKRVYSAEELSDTMPDGRYMIANTTHGREMKKQLESLGVTDERILICDNEEFFLRKIFVKVWQYADN